MSDSPSELEQARLASLSSNYSEAIDSIDLWLRSHPDDVRALLLKGNTLELNAYSTLTECLSFENCQQLHAAKLCYERVLELEPRNTDAMTDLANLLKGARRYHECAALLRSALPLLWEQSADDSAREAEEELDEVLCLAAASEGEVPHRPGVGS